MNDLRQVIRDKMISKAKESWATASTLFDIGANKQRGNVLKKCAYINAASKFYHPSVLADVIGVNRTSILHHIKKHDSNMEYAEYKDYYIHCLKFVISFETQQEEPAI